MNNMTLRSNDLVFTLCRVVCVMGNSVGSTHSLIVEGNSIAAPMMAPKVHHSPQRSARSPLNRQSKRGPHAAKGSPKQLIETVTMTQSSPFGHTKKKKTSEKVAPFLFENIQMQMPSVTDEPKPAASPGFLGAKPSSKPSPLKPSSKLSSKPSPAQTTYMDSGSSFTKFIVFYCCSEIITFFC